MKLVADSRSRLTSSELFAPGQAFNAVRQANGRIVLAELVPKESQLVRARVFKGKMYGAAVKLDRAEIAAAIRAERDER